MLTTHHHRRFGVMAASRFLSPGHPARESDFSLFSVSNPPSPIVSPKGIIHVLGYTPKEGERGVPITVRIHFRCDLPQPIYVRLLVGHKPVPTKVREVSGSVYGRWQLDAAAPSHDEENAFTKVLLSVQALTDDGVVVDAATFGEFSYWAPCTCLVYSCLLSNAINKPVPRELMNVLYRVPGHIPTCLVPLREGRLLCGQRT
jgi:hypothetical protein